jgi:hypothetical protein
MLIIPLLFYLGFEAHKLGFWDRQAVVTFYFPPSTPFLALSPSHGLSQSPPEARGCAAELKSPIY